MEFRVYKQSFERGLIRHGQRKADAKAATSLAWLMMVYDRAVFQAPALPVSYDINSEAARLVTAAYMPRGDDGQEAYFVHVPGIHAWLAQARRRQAGVFVVTPQEYELVQRGELVPATWLQMLASIAAHEVRHRVQFKRPDLKKFTPGGCPPGGKSTVECAWRISSANWVRRCVAVVASDMHPTAKAGQMGDDEFDAFVIGIAALNAIRSGASLEDIIALISQDAPA